MDSSSDRRQFLQGLARPMEGGFAAVNPSATCANDKRLIILRKCFLSLMQSKELGACEDRMAGAALAQGPGRAWAWAL